MLTPSLSTNVLLIQAEGRARCPQRAAKSDGIYSARWGQPAYLRNEFWQPLQRRKHPGLVARQPAILQLVNNSIANPESLQAKSHLVRGARVFLIYWLPVIIWMGVVFSASTSAFSARHTSRIIGPILRWFKPDVTDETISRVQLVFRKGGHLSEYAVLGMLFWNAWRKPVRGDQRPWSWHEAAIALAFSAAYAITDEIHQAFVPGRQAQATDVLIDSVGAAIGLLLLWMFGRRKKLW